MCLIAFAWKTRPDLPLVLASNRDEYFDRPAAPAGWWRQPGSSADILGGRDLQAGGTWMGITATGRFAALTNFRSPNDRKPDAPSRGPLVADFLAGQLPPGEYLDTVATRAAAFNGFSLMCGDVASGALWIYSNRSGSPPEALGPGIYGLSNALLDTPWPKLLAARDRLRVGLDERSPDLVEHLLDTLADPELAAEYALPATGVDPALEKALSAIFIVPAARPNHPAPYGTRTSTILTVAGDGTVVYHERDFTALGTHTDRVVRFELPAPVPAGAPR